ncbi:MAG: nucleoside triphosphate pyrophosphatase [Robiginitomaculum sp.]|nr:nucleoside triphosphate pyrophosphatase [Robiginitomaculum sp.]MDQ7078903.1 nucleoside triphosphate pyrophosphatase [Robiginitomaculum sp.]
MSIEEKQKPALVLASASAIRQTILKNAGIVFDVCPSPVDENRLKADNHGLDAKDMSTLLAKEKALQVSAHDDRLILGADQILEFQNRQYDKVNTLEEAKDRLQTLSGQCHDLVGALVLVQEGKTIWQHQSRAHMHMRSLSDAAIDAYLRRAGTGILASVGCYEIEGLGITLFERIEGDHFSILGLSLLPLLKELRRREIILP